MRRLLIELSCLVLALSATAAPPTRILDLGHPLSDTDPSWSGSPEFSRKGVQGEGFAMGSFSSEEHFGTHLDAPVHSGGTWTTDRIPVERLLRPGVRIDVQVQVAANEDYRLSVEDVHRFEAQEGRIPEGAVILVATGWDRRWPDQARYMNERDEVKHFPGLSVEAAAFLVRERTVAGIGIDTPSVDHGPSEKFEVHRTTMPANVYHVENATGLTSLPAKGFSVLVAPVNLAGGSGGPTRLFALFDR
ncbi:MAG TPA: cyclase family protein [Vicinamibacteria bacterium]|nr:cyclase family protein [Vicinamibacteria bacterium]